MFRNRHAAGRDHQGNGGGDIERMLPIATGAAYVNGVFRRSHADHPLPHGKRRAAEMDASAETLAALGVEPIMARAIAARERWSAEIGLSKTFDKNLADPTVADFLRAVAAANAARKA